MFAPEIGVLKGKVGKPVSTERSASLKRGLTIAIRFIGRWAFFVILNVLAPVFGRFVRPGFLFLVYGNDRDRAHYCPTRLQKFLPPLVTIGVMRWKKEWGIVLGYPYGYRSLLGNKTKLEKFLSDARRLYPKAGRIALAGRLPGLCEKEGISLQNPFVSGVLGTVFTMCRAAKHLADLTRKPADQLRFAVLGGGGNIGQKLVAELKGQFGEVISFDSRYKGAPFREKNVIHTFDENELRTAHAVIVLTAKGEDIRDYSHVFGQGVILGDDTHPCMTPGLIAKLQRQGVVVLKVTTRNGLVMVPRLPNFRKEDIPGCLLEAIVCQQTGTEVFSDQSAFNTAAVRLGFEACLAPHTDV